MNATATGAAAGTVSVTSAPSPHGGVRRWLRRARPLLGTLVEVGVEAEDGAAPLRAVDAAFDAVAEVQACLSRFDAASDLSRFHALPAGGVVTVRRPTAEVLAAAQALHEASGGAFDLSLGSAPRGWRCEDGRLHRLDAAARLDAGGIAKGHAVDRAVAALVERGCAGGWVNAGGDVRVFGTAELPIVLRDEAAGGVRPFATLADGAFATSRYGAGSRSRLHAAGRGGSAPQAHASVAAPLCLWADALTKVVAASGDAAHPLLARHGARAWLHGREGRTRWPA